MKRLNVAIIGCGRISEAYKKAFLELIEQGEADVVFCADVEIDRVKAYAADFANCKASADYRDLFGMDIDVVHVATPHYLHHTMAIDCMEHGYNVLTEKPMAIDLDKADQMIETAKRTGKTFGVIFQTRYTKGCFEMKRIIESGELGKVLGARSYLSWIRTYEYYHSCDWKGTWSGEGGGTLIDQAIHSMDRVQWLIGSDIDWAEGHCCARNHSYLEVEDTAEALVGFKNGAMYHLYATNNYAINAPIEIEIVGEKGKMGLIRDLAWIEMEGQERRELRENYDGIVVGKDYWGASHLTQIRDFYDSVRTGKPVFVDGPAGRKVLELIRGIYLSSQRGGQRIAFPFVDEPIEPMKP